MAGDQLSRVFAALSDPTRRNIVERLAGGDATVGELARHYDVSLQAVSKHIGVLVDAGLLSQQREAQRRRCHLEAEVFSLATKWLEKYRIDAQQRYERLDALLVELADAADPHPDDGTGTSTHVTAADATATHATATHNHEGPLQ